MSTPSRPDSSSGTSRDRFGEITLVLAVTLYIAAIVFFVVPLPSKLDTFLVVSWVFAPAIVGALIYIKMERSGGWRQSRTLR